MVLFGGLVKIPFYSYRWVLTSAQIDLMAIDVPLVVYSKDKTDTKHTKKEMSDMMKKWEEKRAKAGLDTGFKPTGKANLNDFMRTGMDAFKHTKTE